MNRDKYIVTSPTFGDFRPTEPTAYRIGVMLVEDKNFRGKLGKHDLSLRVNNINYDVTVWTHEDEYDNLYINIQFKNDNRPHTFNVMEVPYV